MIGKPTKATRQSFGEALAELGEKHREIVVLDADLSKSTKSDLFAKKFPDRFVEMGIAEMNMVGTAAGLAFAGKIPFACSFGCFLTGRYDTIRISVAYAQANVRLVGTHSGVGIGDDGHSQMGLEDVALMRALPQMGVFQPMDAASTHAIMRELVETWKGPAYLRLTRQNLPDLVPLATASGSKFEFGKLFEVTSFLNSSLPTQPKLKVSCFATGAATAEAVHASIELAKHGIALKVWDAHSLKPFDQAGLMKAVQGAGLILSVEDHSVIGGLGSIVAEELSAHSNHAPLVRLGVQDLFGESGEGPELFEKHGFSTAGIVRTILEHRT